VTRQITLPLRYEADFLDGAYDATFDSSVSVIGAGVWAMAWPLQNTAVARNSAARLFI
jgi:hypothetical protein